MASYRALRFDAAADEVDGWADALLEAGALSVDIDDPSAGTDAEAAHYDEPGAEASGFWPVNRVTALFAADVEVPDALGAAARKLGLGVPAHERYDVPERDWVRATQAQFAPIRIDQRLWIVPSWCDPIEADAVNLILDPGLAFGTGSHPTTRLCLAWLVEHLPAGTCVLDYGCGSGILAIAAAKLGASDVTGTDIDAQAIAASRDNALRNGVSANFATPEALATVRTTFDVVIANILANPLVLLAPALAAKVRSGGWIILSGILLPQSDAVCGAYSRWFTIAPWRSEDGWVALAGVRRDDAT